MATSKIVELDETNTCKICDNALAKYSCPKCNILYCSLDCYQSVPHTECSESFYKDSVLSELQFDEGSKEMKAKMLEILQKSHENNKVMLSDEEKEDLGCDLDDYEDLDSDDDPEFLDIGERLAGVNLDDAEKVWDKLTEDEKQDFVAFLKSEDVTKLIPSWKPWWLQHDESKVKDLSKIEDYKKGCPEIGPIKNLTDLTNKTPADCVRYNLINILASYAFTTRYFNGEHFDFPQEAISCLVSISLTLKSGENFGNFELAVKSVEQECINSDWIVSDAENMQTMRVDLERILKGPNAEERNYYILCCLSDMYCLFVKGLLPANESNGNFNKKFPNEHFPEVKLEPLDRLKANIKKMEYYMSYAKDCYTLT